MEIGIEIKTGNCFGSGDGDVIPFRVLSLPLAPPTLRLSVGVSFHGTVQLPIFHSNIVTTNYTHIHGAAIPFFA